MSKRTRKQLIIDILEALDKDEPKSYGQLEREVNTNWKTIRDTIEILEAFGAVAIIREQVQILKLGQKALKKLKS